jgi:hypothetical protein
MIDAFDVPGILAEELHRQYRAAEKALRPVHELSHDHGFGNCANKKYFYKRAKLIIKRSKLVNPQNLMEAEEALASAVLIRRSIVRGN